MANDDFGYGSTPPNPASVHQHFNGHISPSYPPTHHVPPPPLQNGHSMMNPPPQLQRIPQQLPPAPHVVSDGWGVPPPNLADDGTRVHQRGSGASTPSLDFSGHHRNGGTPTNGYELPSIQQGAAIINGHVNNVNSHASMGDKENHRRKDEFSKDTQDKANQVFSQVFSDKGGMTVKDALDFMKSMKASPNPNDRETLSCIIEMLFDEYQYLGKYPEKELTIIAEIYGGLIRENITDQKLDSNACIAVLKKIADSLCSPDLKSGNPDAHNYFKFGLHALNEMRMKLCQFSNLCVYIARKENFPRIQDPLRQFILAGSTGSLPTQVLQQVQKMQQLQQQQLQQQQQQQLQQQQQQQQKQKTLEVVPTSLNAPNVDALVRIQQNSGAIIQPPSAEIAEQVSFFFNNLSQSELPRKVQEMQRMMARHGDQFVQWVAQQLVVYRVLGQPNFMTLYAKFVHEILSKPLEAYVHRETFRNIRVLLKNDKRIPLANSAVNDRQHLKTLGSWLGLLTIAKDRPILHKDLNLKSLLLEAAKKGEQELNFAVPFVAKILYGCQQSTVFTTTSSWLKPLFEILCEIHGLQDIKTNLKFEIELLTSKLGLTIDSHNSSGHLTDMESIVIKKPQLFEPGQPGMSAPPPVPLPLPPQPMNPPPGLSIMPNYDAYNSSASSSPIPQPMRADSFSSRGTSPLPAPVSQPRIPTPNVPPVQAPPPAAARSPHPQESQGTDMLVQRLVIYPNLALFRHYPALKENIKENYRRFVNSEEFQKLIQTICRRAIPLNVKTIEELVRKDFRVDLIAENVQKSAAHITHAISAAWVHFEFKCHLIPMMFKVFREALSGNLQISSCMADEAARKLAEDNVDEITGMVLGNITESMKMEVMKLLQHEFEARAKGHFVPNNDVPLPPKLQEMSNDPSRMQRIYQFFLRYTRNVTEPRPYDPFSRQLGEIFLNLEKVLKNVAETDCGNDRALRALVILKDLITPDNEPIDLKIMYHLVSSAIYQFLYGYEGEAQPVERPAIAPALSPTAPFGAEHQTWSQILREVFTGLCRCLLTELLSPEVCTVITNVVITMKDLSMNFEAISFMLCNDFLSPSTYDRHLSKIMATGNSTTELFAFAQNLFRTIANMNVQHSVQTMLPEVAMWCTRTRHELVLSADPHRRKAVEIMKKWQVYEMNQSDTGAEELDALMKQHNITDVNSVKELIVSATRYVIDCTYDVLKTDSTAFARTTLLKSLPGLFFQFVESFKEMDDKKECLKAIFESLVNAVIKDHEYRDYDFYGYPYDFLLKSYLKLFNENSGAFKNKPELLVVYALYLERLQPKKCPRFIFGWFNNVGSGSFMAKYLDPTDYDHTTAKKLQAVYAKLLIYHLDFLRPFLRDVNVKTPAMQRLQIGTTKVLFYIMNVYPDLFCDHHHAFCDVIPPNCFQMRTQILSAIPTQLKHKCSVTDAYDLDSIENSELMKIDPVVSISILEEDKYKMCKAFVDCKPELDNYLNNRTPVNYLIKLRNLLKINNKERNKYDVTLLNIIVLYVGMEAIKFHREQNHEIQFSTIGATSYMDVLQNLAVQFCNEGRYLLFNAMANQLRYPNSQTKYFSMAMLYIFRESTVEHVQEQIARTLFERAICRAPHPWGVVATLAQLVTVDQYQFWSHDFANCASEFSGLFQKIQFFTGERRRQAELANAAAEAPN